MYTIMYKCSAFKINRKSFPNNIKDPIAPDQRKQSHHHRHPRPRPGIFQQQTPCCHKTTWGHRSIESEGGQAHPALNITVMFYIRRTRYSRLCGSK